MYQEMITKDKIMRVKRCPSSKMIDSLTISRSSQNLDYSALDSRWYVSKMLNIYVNFHVNHVFVYKMSFFFV